MSLDNAGGPTKLRRPSLHGILMQDISHGRERSRGWPRKRGSKVSAATKEQNDAFREAQQSAKYWDPRNIIEVSEWREGTPILPRDLQVMMMYNRLFVIVLPNGTKVYSMAARQDVSDSLDAISPEVGTILYRADEGWRVIPRAYDEGLALQSSAELMPEWKPLEIGHNLAWYYAPPTAASFPTRLSGLGAIPTMTDDPDVGLIIANGPTVGGDKQRFVLKDLPGAGLINWTVTTHMTPTLWQKNYNGAGLVAYQASTNRAIGIWQTVIGGATIHTQARDLAAFRAEITTGFVSGMCPWFARLQYIAATNHLLLSYSIDGKSFTLMSDAVVAGYFTGVPTKVGFGFINNNVDGKNIFNTVDMWQQSWA